MAAAIGFIGVGKIVAPMVHGLRDAWPDLRMALSPRSEAISRSLAEADLLIERMESNAAVVAASRIVVLAVLPTQLDAVLRELRFQPDQIVVSCVAGAPAAEVAALVAPARACRLVPLPMIARREGPILLYPTLPEIAELFGGLGDLVVPQDEGDFATYAAGGAVMSTFFALEIAIAAWMTKRGATSSSASIYVRSLFRAAAETAFQTDADRMPALIAGHETPGGLNEHVRLSLEVDGWFTAPNAAFERLTNLRRDKLRPSEDD